MKATSKIAVFLVILLITGCVSSSEYKARLSEIDILKGDVTALKGKLADLESQKKGLESGLSDTKRNYSALEERLKTTEAELSDIGKRYAEALVSGKALQEDNANLKRLLEAKKDELTGEILALKASLSENEQKIKTLKDDLRSAETQVLELKAEIASLSTEKSKAVEERDIAIGGLKTTYDTLVKEMSLEIQKGEIAITQLRDKLSLSLVEKILFDSGSADIKKEGMKVLDRVGEILKNVTDKQIKVEGHTDNVPISLRLRKKFPTNWELSAARATTVIRYLQENSGIEPTHLIAAGYAEFRPITGNETEQGRAKNRRIEIVLIPVDIDRIIESR